MYTVQYFDGKEWIFVSEWPTIWQGWATLGENNFNHRIIDKDGKEMLSNYAKQLYYIVSLKHTSRGDTALTFWGTNRAGYVWNKEGAGLYTEAEAKKSTAADNVMVEKEKVDPFWMNAVDFEDKYVAVPNNPTVRHHLGLNDKFMKPKNFASCQMVFTNLPVNADQ